MKALRKDLLIVASFVILPLLLFWDVTIGGKTMLPIDNLFQWQPWLAYADQFGTTVPQNSLLSDLILQNYPWKQFAIESLKGGEIPLWSPQLFGGAPFLANGQHSMLYPFSLLFFVLPITAAYGWFTVSQLWLAGVSGYIFGRIFNQRRPSAAITGLVYQGAGFILVSAAVFPMILAAAVWLPLLLACVEMIIRCSTSPKGHGNNLPWVILGAVGVGMQILAGHPEITIYTLLLMALFALWRLIGKLTRGRGTFRHLIRPSLWLSVMVFIGLLLGSIQLVPLFSLAQTNFREGSASFTQVMDYGFKPRRILTLALPNFYGNPAHHDYTDPVTGETVPFELNAWGNLNPHGAYSSSWGIKNYVEGGIYLGILPLVLAGLGTIHNLRKRDQQDGDHFDRSRRRTISWFMLVLSFFSLAFIFGTPLYAILYYGLPFINQLHSPFRWVFALSLCVATLAGFGVDSLCERRTIPQTKRVDEVTLLAIVLLLAGLATAAATLLVSWRFGSFEGLFDRTMMALAQAPDAFANGRAFFGYLYPQLMALGIVTALSALLVWLSRRSRFWVIGAFVLIVADVFMANQGFHAATDPELLNLKPDMVVWLEEQEGLWRMTTFAPKDKAFNANSGWLYGFEDVRGYDSIINKQFTEYMAAIEPQNELDFNRIQPIKDWQALNSPLLDLLNVRFIVSAETLNLPKLTEVWSGEGVRIYENLAVVPRAYTMPHSAVMFTDDALALSVEFDPRRTLLIEAGETGYPPSAGNTADLQPASVTSYGNIKVWIDAAVAEPSWLVLNDSYADGWRAFVRPIGAADEAEVELDIELVNGNFRAVFLEDAGQYSVRFRYSPRTFILGGLASFMAGISLAFGTAVWLWRRFYRQDGELTNTQSIAKNSMVPMALNLFNKAIDFIFAAFYLRVLGPAESGGYAGAITIALWFEIVANWGLDALMIREVSQDRGAASKFLLNTSVLRLGTMFIGILPVSLFLLEGYVNGSPVSADILTAIILIAIGMVFSGMSKGFAGLFYAFEAAEYPATLTTVSTILKVAFGVFVLLAGWGFVGLAGVSIVTNVITLALLAFVAFRKFPLNGPWTIDADLQKKAFRMGYPLMINHLLATIFFKIDQPLLLRIDGEEAVGWYNTAYKWVDAFNIIPSFFTFALFPIISRQVTSNMADARRTFRMSVKLMVLIALPLAAVVTILADFMIGTLGGDEFLPHGAIALRMVMWSIPIGWINSVTNYMIVSLGLERRLTWGFVVGVLFNTVGNIIFIPMFSYQAAAVTTILSELILLIMFNYYLTQRMEKVGWFELLWRPVVITLVMLGVMVLGAQINIVLGLALGVFLYPLGLVALKVFGEEERRILVAIVPDSVAQRIGRTKSDAD